MRSPSYQMITTQPKRAQLWHFECPHQRLRHIFIPAHSERKVLVNLYIQMGKGQGKDRQVATTPHSSTGLVGG